MQHRRLAAALLAAVTACSMLCPFSAQAAGMTFQELREKFPDGKYWNHLADAPNNPDGWTDTPCNHSGGGKAECNMFTDHSTRGMQCAGYAMKLTYEIYGSSFLSWERDQDLSAVKPGDSIRLRSTYGGHSIVVLGTEGDYLVYTDCNTGNTCKIGWDRKMALSTVKSRLDYIAHAPYAALSGTAQARGDISANGVVDASDAALVLIYAADKGAGRNPELSSGAQTAADVNRDSSVNASDAALILIYSAMAGAGQTPDWAQIVR